jgi:tetratricopeptide (TPR) repeat protein
VLSCSPIEIQLRCDLEIQGQNLAWDRLKGDFRFTRYSLPEEQQKALEDYTRALQAHPEDYELLFQRSMVHCSLYGHEEAAVGDLERALGLAPKDWARRAKANESLDNVRKAIQEK